MNLQYRLLAQRLLRHLQSREGVFILVLAVVIGLLSGALAIFFRLLIQFIQSGFQHVPDWSHRILGVPWWGIVAAPVLGGLIVGPMIWRFAPEARGHGVPEVMAAVLRRGGFIRFRVVVVKAFASAICIGSGGSVGREGPIVQMGSATGSTVAHLLHLPPRLMRTLVACGAAGGIAATFNAPIAGALFAVEIILGDFAFIQLAPIVTSAVIATVVSRSLIGNFAAFGVPAYALQHPLELVAYAGLGLLCGLVGVLFIILLERLELVFEHKRMLHPAIQPALGGLVVGLVGLAFPQVFGVGYEAIDQALYGHFSLWVLGALVLAKLIATTVTLASGGSGGIFAPSLFMGAMLGGAVGKLTHGLLPAATEASGAYALVGMGAMVGATTHAPLTGMLIIFELTSDYKIILPLMISTVIGVVTASYLKSDSIYSIKLRRQGIEFDRSPEPDVLRHLVVGDIMRHDVPLVPRDLPFNFVVDELLDSARSHLPVVDDEECLIGIVDHDIARTFLSEKNLLAEVVIAQDAAHAADALLLPGDSLAQAMMRFNESGRRELYVLEDLVERRVVGIVRKGDLMDVYHAEMLKRSRGETFAYLLNRPHDMEPMKVLDGYGVVQMEAPHAFSGKPLRELDLRNRYGVNVLAIKRQVDGGRSGELRVWVPESTDRLEDGDVLVLLGRTERLDDLATGW